MIIISFSKALPEVFAKLPVHGSLHYVCVSTVSHCHLVGPRIICWLSHPCFMYKRRHLPGSSSKYKSSRSVNLSGAALDYNRSLTNTQGEWSKWAGSGSSSFQSSTTTWRFLSPYSPAVTGGLVKPRHKSLSLFGLGYTVLGDCSTT